MSAITRVSQTAKLPNIKGSYEKRAGQATNYGKNLLKFAVDVFESKIGAVKMWKYYKKRWKVIFSGNIQIFL